MPSAPDPTAAILILGAGILILFFVLRFVGRILVYVARQRLARLHAIRSIPLPRHATLLSGTPSTQIEAVLLDVFDTEYRRTVEDEPHYGRYSAEEFAELRVFLFQRAFRRKAPRVLYEIEVGVPLHRKFQEGDPDVCAWALKRLKANPPLFGKPDSIDDLVLKPSRFRRFLWTHGVGSSPVFFLEDLFRALPISIVPRALRSTGPRADDGAEQLPSTPGQPGGAQDAANEQLPSNPDQPGNTRDVSAEQLPSTPDRPSGTRDGANANEQLPSTPDRPDSTAEGGEPLRDLVTTLGDRVRRALETGDEAEIQGAIANARTAMGKAAPDPPPEEVRAFLERLDGYEQRLASFEAAFEAETSKPMDDWAPWVRAALAAATAGGDLAALGEDAMLDVFQRHARRLWVTSTEEATAARDLSTGPDHPRSEAQADAEDTSTTKTSDEGSDDASVSPVPSSAHPTDKGTEIGF